MSAESKSVNHKTHLCRLVLPLQSVARPLQYIVLLLQRAVHTLVGEQPRLQRRTLVAELLDLPIMRGCALRCAFSCLIVRVRRGVSGGEWLGVGGVGAFSKLFYLSFLEADISLPGVTR